MKKRVLVIGAGAAGLVAAICAAQAGAEVIVLEQTAEIGKKLLSTGNGRCNFTNTDQALSHYHSVTDRNGDFVRTVLSAFSEEDTLQFFREIGIWPEVRTYGYDEGGYVYPASGEARSVRDALLSAAKANNVRFLTECFTLSVAHLKDKDGRVFFQLDTTKGMLAGEALIVATGSCAAPKTGSDGTGLQIPAAFGHYISEFQPSLCALRCVGSFFRDLKGVRTRCRLRLEIAKADPETEALRKKEYEEIQADHYVFLPADLLSDSYECSGELQFTDYGVSGIPAFQLSRYASLAVKLRRERYVVIDTMPELSREALLAELLRRRDRFADRTADGLLLGLLPEKLCAVYLKRSGIRPESGIYLLTDEQLQKLAELIKGMRVGVLDTNGFDNCQCCAGGVNTEEINPETMESRLIDGLFFAGEIIDVDGDCGGYNLQWAWSSGALAGVAAAMRRHYRRYPEQFPSNSETYGADQV